MASRPLSSGVAVVSTETDLPFRGELLGSDRLDELVRDIAGRWSIGERRGAQSLLRRLRDNGRVLRQAHAEAAVDAEARNPITPEAEWLLDNFFVIEDVLREVRTDLPRKYLDELPVFTAGPWVGVPRVYVLAVILVTHTDCQLEEGLILRLVRAFQEVTPLATGELWAVPTMLRLAVLENLRRLAGQMLVARTERAQAADWVTVATTATVPPPLPEYPSDTFLVAWHTAIRDRGSELSLDRVVRSSRYNGDLSEVLRREHRRQAANQVSVGNGVTALRLLNAIDWAEFFERASQVEEVLRAEPTGVYARQDFATRDRYRQAVERLAKSSGRDEVEVAREVVRRAADGSTAREQHVGYYLIDEGRKPLMRDLGCRPTFRERRQIFLTDHPHAVLFGGVAALTLAGVAAVAALAWLVGAGPGIVVLMALLAILPASELAVALVNYAVAWLLPPRVLPKLTFLDGIPAEWRTVVVIPGMLTRTESATRLAERLELHHLASPDPELRFALLTDFADAPSAEMPNDDDLVQSAVTVVRQLNERYAAGGPDRFFLFHRRREYNPAEGCWMGWERKRGKLEEFNHLLRGAEDTTYVVKTGDAAAMGARFVLTLDADTVLPRDAAQRLIATLAHPLNRPVLSADGRRVVAGYGVIQPRVSFLFQTGTRSRFARIFAGSAGIDPYSSAASDVYQDLFGWGTFTGKGLYDVEAFDATAGRAFPDNHVLSHDLIESNFARCGLASDIEVFDDFPARYHAYARREHRWVRGDWQLLPWLGRTVPTAEGRKPNVLTALGKWKIFDNLRRSLVPLALVVFLAAGWTLVPGTGWGWSLAALLVLTASLVLLICDSVRGVLAGAISRGQLSEMGRRLVTTASQIGLSAAFLANQALVAADAIARTLYRLFVSRRRLLEWETAAAAEARLGTGLGAFAVAMGPAVVLAVVLAALILWAHPVALIAAFLWLAAWALSPVLAWWVSQPLPVRVPSLPADDRAELHRTARKTWRFFETFVTAEDNWLPPDNYQETPKGVVAHRTSPTNVGLLFLSTLSAHDLGYLTLPVLVDRLRNTFDTLAQLEKHRGHLLNWYETTTLKVLHPAYVSTVDSGNLLGCLLALQHGLVGKAAETVPSGDAAGGLLDTVNLAAESLPADELRAHLAGTPGDLLGWDDWLARAADLAARMPAPSGDGGYWVGAVAEQVRTLREELESVCPWLVELRTARTITDGDERWQTLCNELNTPASADRWVERLPVLTVELAGWAKGVPAAGREAVAERLVAALEQSRAAELATGLRDLARRAVELADGMDFRFLYNESRHLFTIGFNVPLDRQDPAHYDLLASEACLTSFLAIARGVVPRKHWFQLGRLITRAAGRPGLISWGGTMFEYLMPRLVLPSAAGTLLDTAQRTAVARQIEYGRQSRVPWGISESGFYAMDATLDYQYQSFGVPGLGLKRGLARDLVIAPYATLLAVSVEAEAAASNLAALRAAGGEGAYGFYEALDFTPERVARGHRCEIVRSYMAHHQGMGLCAITNRLRDDIHCRRLRTEPAVRAVELLLQERVPMDAPDVRPAESGTSASGVAVDPAVSRRITRVDTPAPRSHLLSNGQYTVMVTNCGGGFSACRGLAVTRWRNDPTRDHHGTFLYLRDADSGATWSAGYQPTTVRPDHYEVIFAADKAEFRRRDGAIETHLEVVVAPDQDVEVRRLTLANHDTQARTLEVTSYAEVVLADPRADLAHPAFGKLFLETEWQPRWDALVCRRRPRSPEEAPVFAVHLVVAEPTADAGPTQFETDRAKFLGRRRTPAAPEALGRPLTGTVGSVLDPVFALRKPVRLAPGTTTTLEFVTAITRTQEAALTLADHYRAPAAAARAFELAWAHSRVELRTLGVAVVDSHLYQRLAGHVLFPPPALRAVGALKTNRQGQPGLWRYGISGDLPIVVVALPDGGGLPLVREVLKAHAFWRGRGFQTDLVLLADQSASYREELYEDLGALVRASDDREMIDRPGGVFVRKTALLGEDDRALLLATARVVLYGDRGTLADQTDAVARGKPLPPARGPVRGPAAGLTAPVHVGELIFANGTGGFTPDGREYVVTGIPPAPWANVIANPVVGCLTTESGLGPTWVGNSQMNRLTPWSNDPVSDPPAEVVYLRDEETGETWSPTPLPAGRGTPAAVWHGAGYTSFVQERPGLGTELTVFVPNDDPVKIVRLRVHNRGDRQRRLSATFFAEWVLGVTRDQAAPFVVTEVDTASGALLARNAFNAEFGSAVALADISLRPRTLTGDRGEFLGRNGSLADPAALRRTELSGAAGAGLDPCAALQGRFEVAPGQSASVVFVLGQADDTSSAVRLATHYRDPETAEEALHQTIAAWDRRLSAVTVRTPDAALDVMVNRWLPYQVLACRLWGRTAFYQSGGAYGFRDQLQDVLALLYAEPAQARAHLLRAAARQFHEGDVQHWWHPPAGRGVRTRFSDDFLWLPYAAARYARVTGDTGVFDEPASYLRGPALAPEQQESYFLPDESAEVEPLYQHCLRALDHGWALGSHGLPLMGCGDWNDGMNRVGIEGKGESVWVAWFQILVRSEFAAVAEARGDTVTASTLRQQVEKLRESVEAHAWDGEWYLRAWFDNGTPLGSASNDECRIDSLTQSWAVLSGAGDTDRAARAVDAAVAKLVDRENRLVKLFTPPFDQGLLSPGYIKGYVPGIRENGGQYTHAAIWLAQALAGLGRGGQAHDLWSQICPVGYAETPDAVARYRVEPYVVAADVYAVPPHVSRGGWTWYTGSAAWLYRAALESLLGFNKQGDQLTLDPRIPAGWSSYVIEFHHGAALYHCRVENPGQVEQGVAEITLDGVQILGKSIPLLTEGHHELLVKLRGK